MSQEPVRPRYSNLAIELVLTLQLVFHLALRQAEGFARSVLALLGLNLAVSESGALLPLLGSLHQCRLPGKYPMTAPNYARLRSELAKSRGLGREPVTGVDVAEPAQAKAPKVTVPPACRARGVKV